MLLLKHVLEDLLVISGAVCASVGKRLAEILVEDILDVVSAVYSEVLIKALNKMRHGL